MCFEMSKRQLFVCQIQHQFHIQDSAQLDQHRVGHHMSSLGLVGDLASGGRGGGGSPDMMTFDVNPIKLLCVTFQWSQGQILHYKVHFLVSRLQNSPYYCVLHQDKHNSDRIFASLPFMSDRQAIYRLISCQCILQEAYLHTKSMAVFRFPSVNSLCLAQPPGACPAAPG